jgi:tetratricopeptide (TPR) repeat protein
MNNSNQERNRGKLAYLSIFGTTQIHLRNPYIIALWSVAFPGYGHLLLSKYIRGFSLVLWELFINQSTQLNLAIVYSFMGDIESAKEVLDVRYMHLYIPVYLFAIWDSYRTTVDLNKIYLLNEKEAPQAKKLILKPLEINYLDKRSPIVAALWAMTIPSVGQLYIHRIFGAFFTLIMTVVYVHFSNFLEGFHYLLLGEIEKSTEVLNKQWLLYMPSFYFFTIYDSYMNVVENNKLFDSEQKKFLKKHYQPATFKIKKGIKV